MDNSYKFFCNKDCEYFPCHKIPDGTNFNCLFCYCPLNSKMDCGGNYSLIQSSNGNIIKDCSNCTFPHITENYDKIIEKLTK